ncbi:hypothetical protein O4H66_25210 [Comamonadaceae bacterium G21597-S1]|nr:hypothetical protein [Comamonadaceae bacterium G21597-S1]
MSVVQAVDFVKYFLVGALNALLAAALPYRQQTHAQESRKCIAAA